MNDLIAALVKAGAPILGSLVGGPVATVGVAVIGALADALGTPSTPEAIIDAINKRPEAAAIVKDVETQRAASLVSDAMKDIQDARATNLNLVKEGSHIAWSPAIVSVLIVILFSLVLTVFLTKPIQFSEAQSALLNITVGTLTAAFTQVVNYWLGSSAGSASKDAAIKNISATK